MTAPDIRYNPDFPFVPYGMNIVVLRDVGTEEITEGGIVAPDDPVGEWDSSKHSKGWVVQIGTGQTTNAGTLIQPRVDIGDYVLFRAGEDVRVGAIVYSTVHDNAIVGTRTDKKLEEDDEEE